METLPALPEVRCYDLFPAAAAAFVAEMGAAFPALRFTVCAGAAEAAAPADVVVTAIPIVDRPGARRWTRETLKEGGLAVSLDYDSAWTSAAMRDCDKFCADDVAQLLATQARTACTSAASRRRSTPTSASSPRG